MEATEVLVEEDEGGSGMECVACGKDTVVCSSCGLHQPTRTVRKAANNGGVQATAAQHQGQMKDRRSDYARIIEKQPDGHIYIKSVNNLILAQHVYINSDAGQCPVRVNGAVNPDEVQAASDDVLILMFDWSEFPQNPQATCSNVSTITQQQTSNTDQDLSQASAPQPSQPRGIQTPSQRTRILTRIIADKTEKLYTEVMAEISRDQSLPRKVVQELYQQFQLRLLGVTKRLEFVMEGDSQDMEKISTLVPEIQQVLATLVPLHRRQAVTWEKISHHAVQCTDDLDFPDTASLRCEENVDNTVSTLEQTFEQHGVRDDDHSASGMEMQDHRNETSPVCFEDGNEAPLFQQPQHFDHGVPQAPNPSLQNAAQVTLDAGLPIYLVTKSRQEIDLDEHLFVKTPSFHRGVELMKTSGQALITAPSGGGATTLGRALLRYFSEKGYLPLVFHDASQWYEHDDAGRKQVVLMDGFIGNDESAASWKATWSQLHQILIENASRPDSLLVLTLPYSIFSEVTESHIRGPLPLLDMSQMPPASESEKLLVVEKHAKKATLEENSLIQSTRQKAVRLATKLHLWHLIPALMAMGSSLADLESACRDGFANELDRNGRAALHFACDKHLWGTAEMLLKAGADPKVADKVKGWTALHYASNAKNHGASELLLNMQATVSSADNFQKTALHYACDIGHRDIVKLLIDHGADVMAGDYAGQTPLHWASKNGHYDITELLLGRDNPDTASARNGRTALHFAADAGNYKVVEQLLIKCDIDSTDIYGWTALHCASSNGSHDIAKLLLRYSADVTATTSFGRFTALHLASIKGHSGVVELLLDADSDPDIACNQRGWTALHHASDAGQYSVVHQLLVKKATVDLTDRDGSTALHLASDQGRHNVVELLLDYGADPMALNNLGNTALHHASFTGSCDVISLLLAKGIDPNVSSNNRRGYTALHCTAAAGNSFAMELLLVQGAVVDFPDNDKKTALDYATRNKQDAVVSLLKKNGASVRTVVTEKGWTALHYASHTGNDARVRELLTKGATVNCTDSCGWTALHHASHKGHQNVARLLLDSSAYVNATDKTNWTALHYASSEGNLEIAELLLDREADVNAKEKQGWTPLHHAADKNRLEIGQLLLSRGGTVDLHCETGFTALHLACFKHHEEFAQLLLKHGAEINAADGLGWTGLHHAADIGNKLKFRTLVARGASTKARNKDGLTPDDISRQYGLRSVPKLVKKAQKLFNTFR